MNVKSIRIYHKTNPKGKISAYANVVLRTPGLAPCSFSLNRLLIVEDAPNVLRVKFPTYSGKDRDGNVIPVYNIYPPYLKERIESEIIAEYLRTASSLPHREEEEYNDAFEDDFEGQDNKEGQEPKDDED